MRNSTAPVVGACHHYTERSLSQTRQYSLRTSVTQFILWGRLGRLPLQNIVFSQESSDPVPKRFARLDFRIESLPADNASAPCRRMYPIPLLEEKRTLQKYAANRVVLGRVWRHSSVVF